MKSSDLAPKGRWLAKIANKARIWQAPGCVNFKNF